MRLEGGSPDTPGFTYDCNPSFECEITANTNDDNGTIGKEDGDKKETYVITVTDKANVVIPNCDIYIGESNNVVVDLPEGVKPTRENPVIVTITDQNGEAQADVTVIALGDADFIEKGKTDIYGKITLPTSADGYTDEEGHLVLMVQKRLMQKTVLKQNQVYEHYL